MNTIIATQDELSKLIADALPEIKDLALAEMERRINKYDLNLSENLYRSFKAVVLGSAASMQQEMILNFNLYGRFKDMRYVEYGNFRQPNNAGKKYAKDGKEEELPDLVQAMKTMIEENGGIKSNNYVPGYTTNGSKRMPVTTRDIERLAWTLAIDRLKKGRIKNRKKGWYNEARGAIVLKASAVLMKRIRLLALNANAAAAMGKEIVFKM